MAVISASVIYTQLVPSHCKSCPAAVPSAIFSSVIFLFAISIEEIVPSKILSVPTAPSAKSVAEIVPSAICVDVTPSSFICSEVLTPSPEIVLSSLVTVLPVPPVLSLATAHAPRPALRVSSHLIT